MHFFIKNTIIVSDYLVSSIVIVIPLVIVPVVIVIERSSFVLLLKVILLSKTKSNISFLFNYISNQVFKLLILLGDSFSFL